MYMYMYMYIISMKSTDMVDYSLSMLCGLVINIHCTCYVQTVAN